MRNGTCRSCGAAILWAMTPAGRSMPLDFEPTAGGNVVIDGDTAVVLKAALPGTADNPRYTSHFATCPHANQHRRRGK